MTLENYLEKQLHKSTVSNYLYEINRFKKHFPNHEKCHYSQLMHYIGILRNRYQPKTIKRVVYALKKYYDYLIEIEVRKDNPAHFIKLRDAKPTAVQLQDLWTDKELKTLLEPRKERYPILAKRNLLSQGHNLRAVQLFCGHKFLDTTEKYKQSGIKALQDAIDKHHPLQ